MRTQSFFRPEDQRNLIIAIVLSALLVIGWEMFIEAPKRQHLAAWNKQHVQQEKVQKAKVQAEIERAGDDYAPSLTREQRLALSPRVHVQSDGLNGSIALKGLRFDDLVLTHYKETLDTQSPNVTLLSPTGDARAYLAQLGWLSVGNDAVAVPSEHTVWKADRDTLTPEHPVTFIWDNGQNLRFKTTVAMDADYMFHFTQIVENKGTTPVKLAPYGFVNRAHDLKNPHESTEGGNPIGVMGGKLTDVPYADLHDKGEKRFEEASGWLGFSDKYWLTALVPEGVFTARFSYYKPREQDRYQIEYASPAQVVLPGGSIEFHTRMFAGVKALNVLDSYAEGGNADHKAAIPLFDRAVDFGIFYFITKPLFYIISWLYHLTGNFGVAIIVLTLIVKTVMVPLAHKGYVAGYKMRGLQPEFKRLREKYAADPMKMHQQIRALQKREKVSMGSLFLMLVIQIVMFLSLNKVLYVTSEIRQTPFLGWIRDLSAADPSNIFNLFGLIPITLPSALHLGVLPLLMGVAMMLQTKMQPPPPDPVQAKAVKIMPYFFMFVFANMPSGVVLYSLCSSVFSIVHQWIVNRRFDTDPTARHEEGID